MLIFSNFGLQGVAFSWVNVPISDIGAAGFDFKWVKLPLLHILL